MTDYGHDLRFGVFLTPEAESADAIVELSKLADLLAIDLVSFQDHPYQPRFLDTWTLISNVAAATQNVRLAPNVANLPLRPPLILARSVATLDILSRGRIELGLGSGAFWDGIEAMGGGRLTPGQAVDALEEALGLIRDAWDPETRSIRREGEHWSASGARPGPFPVHPVEIWLGAYKPRMLRLTGSKADGWLPSIGYASLAELPDMNARIDAAAADAGRDPSAVRRLLNVGGFGGGEPFPSGPRSSWPEQLAELAVEQGFSTFILPADDEAALRGWAEEVAPATRELVDRARAGEGRIEGERTAVISDPGRDPSAVAPESPRPGDGFGVTPTPDDGTRLSSERPWDDAERPTGPPRDPERTYGPHEEATAQHLIDVHDALRRELLQLRDLIDQVSRGTTDASSVRSFITRMTIRQNNWTLGTFCETYCGHVTGHHTLEDRSVFPHLRRADPRLAAVIDRLGEEHEVIAELLERVDEALVSLVTPEPDGIDQVRAAIDLLTDAMNSHFSYEERELVEPLARVGFS
ncbi:LLM class flavin-dependent oxidoreductase [Thermoleophilia bacterium SCSIO 60948]|nr:LLM class flavin-dependent oxidoreductase [Thermoleophilia bacterium SCSIO 60948]